MMMTMMMKDSRLTMQSSWPRRCFLAAKGRCLILVLSCIFILSLVVCVPCPEPNHLVSYVDGIQDSLDHNTCRSCRDNDARLGDLHVDDSSTSYIKENYPCCSRINNIICINPSFFCFLSTLSEEKHCKESYFHEVPEDSDGPGTLLELLRNCEDNSSSQSIDNASFILSNGTICCSLNSARDLGEKSSSLEFENVDKIGLISFEGPALLSSALRKSSANASVLGENSDEGVESGSLNDGSSSPCVEISPPLLDYGLNYLYSPSLALLTVVNTCNDSILHVYEPFSTDPQFYAYDFHNMLIAPGETASIVFVFLPRLVGSSSAHLVLQTSCGGFLVHAKGLVMESPYEIQALVGLNVSSDERLLKNLSLHNPFDDVLYIEELTAWITLSAENITPYSAHAVCRSSSFQSSDEVSSFLNIKDWLNIESGQLGLPLLGIRPHRQWEVDPHSTETIIEIDILSRREGKVFGAFCLGLLNSSRDRIGMVVVPLEAEVHHGKELHSALTGSVSLFLESLVACDGNKTIIVAISLINGASNVLSVSKIVEVTQGSNLFRVKYMQGLILFPGTITQIALVIYTPPVDSQDPTPEILNPNCKLHVLTNDSTSPLIEIPCHDLLDACPKHPNHSVFAGSQCSYIGSDFQNKKGSPGNTRTGFLGSIIQPSQPSKILEADELILRNWRSQGTMGSFSVLEDVEALFPTVQVGKQYSKWITVKNPSQVPVIMQLVLNSGVTIDQCGDGTDEFMDDGVVHGFSLAETALTEAYVHPHERALLGPIIFHPTNRCMWRSSVLIRNNISGVEWLPLLGFGGSPSLILFEGSEPVRTLNFNFNMPNPSLNSSSSGLLEGISAACVQPLSKEVYAKNTGDVALEVRRIQVSGIGCGSDGFIIHNCRSFALEPGESTRLLISYRTDFSLSVIHRDLELALSTGLLVIPMTASLPAYMLRLCRKSFVWMVVRRFCLVVLVAVALIILVLFCILPRAATVSEEGEQDYLLIKSCEKKSVAPTISGRTETPPDRLRRNQRKPRSVTPRQQESSSELAVVTSSGVLDHHHEDGELGNIAWMEDKHDNFSSSYHQNQKRTPLLLPPVESNSRIATESSGLSEAPKNNNLTVKIERERGRRKKRRGNSLTAKLVEVSSSQSGNSTPSSPVSPLSSFTSSSKRTWNVQMNPDAVQAADSPGYPLVGGAGNQDCHKEQEGNYAATVGRSTPDSQTSIKHCYGSDWLFSSSSAHEQSSTGPRKMTGRPHLMPSATFPSSGWRETSAVERPSGPPFLLASTSVIAPHARAPGSKLKNETSERREEEDGLRKELTYDIWGNHFAEFQSMGRQREFCAEKVVLAAASEGDPSQSFFARAPQSHLQKAPARSVPSSPK